MSTFFDVMLASNSEWELLIVLVIAFFYIIQKRRQKKDEALAQKETGKDKSLMEERGRITTIFLRVVFSGLLVCSTLFFARVLTNQFVFNEKVDFLSNYSGYSSSSEKDKKDFGLCMIKNRRKNIHDKDMINFVVNENLKFSKIEDGKGNKRERMTFLAQYPLEAYCLNQYNLDIFGKE